MPSEATHDMRRVSRDIADGMNVGDHLRPRIAKRRPGFPGLAEKVQIFGAVHPRPRPLSEGGRRNELMLAPLQSREQPIGTFGLLGRALDDAAHQKELRIMTLVLFAIDS